MFGENENKEEELDSISGKFIFCYGGGGGRYFFFKYKSQLNIVKLIENYGIDNQICIILNRNIE